MAFDVQSYSNAAMFPGGGSAAIDLAVETEEERKKRLAEEAQRKALGPAATPYGAAAQTLGLGSYGGAGGRGGY